MSKGLSRQQQSILKIVNDMRTGGGDMSKVNKLIKDKLYPGLNYRYRAEPNANHTKVRYWHKGVVVPADIIYQHRANMAAARVSISRAVTSLVKRGYLERVDMAYKHRSRIYLTDAGKALLSVNEPWKGKRQSPPVSLTHKVCAEAMETADYTL